MINLMVSVCAWCRQRIVADLDEQSSLDWGADGDYGCGEHPMSDMEGTWGHQPEGRRAVAASEAVRDIFAHGKRGDEYVAEARGLVSRLAA